MAHPNDLTFSLPDSSPKIASNNFLPETGLSLVVLLLPLWGSKNRALHPRTGRVLYSPSFAFHPPFALSGDWIGFVFRRDPAHARKASASGFLRKLLSYLGKSRPRQKQVVLTTRMPLERMTHIGGARRMGRIGGGHCCK
ncbi:UNVERIFIED_CONTAM: hypothetical protein Sradi_7293500 [Sesamum radiatum]|uniref:Uncharacterized protein n=1 Tax=Sesamum radiatum TaxID=300843 RepID=A0AAW2IJH6_SESRA